MAGSLGRLTAFCRHFWPLRRCPPGRSCFRLAGFILFYSALLVVDLFLMRKYIYMGPVKALGLEIVPSKPVPAPAE